MKYKISPIAGDASFREFYRFKSKRNSKIFVLTNREKHKNLIVYTAINKFLRNKGISTPRLYNFDFARGLIVIEDFGDLSFYKIIIKKKNKLKIYKRLIDLLLKIQKIKLKKIKTLENKYYVINKYSKKYLHKESDLFFDWYLPLFLNKKKCLKIKIKVKKILSELYNKLNFPNSYFVHRDYHLQNLMKIGPKIGVIDSQDALIGNPAYDLASLIDDVRIKTTKKLKEQIYNYYLKKNFALKKINSRKFLEDFKILSIQRNLKIIGIFSRLYKRDKKSQYLKFIPYTWQLLEMRMNEEIFLELKRTLNKHISKKIRNKIISK